MGSEKRKKSIQTKKTAAFDRQKLPEVEDAVSWGSGEPGRAGMATEYRARRDPENGSPPLRTCFMPVGRR